MQCNQPEYREIDGVISDVNVNNKCKFVYTLTTDDGHEWEFVENNLYYDIGDELHIYFDTNRTDDKTDDIIDFIDRR